MAWFKEIEEFLSKSFIDRKLDNDEKNTFLNLFGQINEDQRRFAINKAFDIARSTIAKGGSSALQALRWLEKINKMIVSEALSLEQANVYFSPGDECRKKLKDLLHGLRKSIDICVFTISDNSLSEAIVAAHNRGITIRIITDNDKAFDKGSDIDYLLSCGVDVRKDQSRYHMHHKFAVFDGIYVASGSFNWTRSASEFNQENILVSNAPKPIKQFLSQFERLWCDYS